MMPSPMPLAEINQMDILEQQIKLVYWYDYTAAIHSKHGIRWILNSSNSAKNVQYGHKKDQVF